MRGMTHHRQQGFMAIVLVVFLVVFVAMAAAIVSMSTSGARGAADHVQASAALFMAESGIEWAAKRLQDVGDAEAYCDDSLQGAGGSIEGSGGFQVLESNFVAGGDEENDGCRVRIRGTSGSASRVVAARVPIMTGDGEFDSIFENANAWEDPQFGGFVQPGVMEIRRNPQCTGPNPTNPGSADGSVITDPFTAGDSVYFVTGFDLVDGTPPAGAAWVRVSVTHAGGTVQCDIDMAQGDSACSADASNPLYNVHDVVLELGSGFAATDVTEISLRGFWGGNACSVYLSDACLGRQSSCLGFETTDNPVSEGSWNEAPEMP